MQSRLMFLRVLIQKFLICDVQVLICLLEMKFSLMKMLGKDSRSEIASRRLELMAPLHNNCKADNELGGVDA